ncbi:nuclease harbi1 [Lasius niger]|uniref:Nuclease harbi1 n=1 Tax=Lasius niger TaxID=67767 RepID=A0A0J7KN26_LASNI|nr:nuclease harbi1 [Lasius niger]
MAEEMSADDVLSVVSSVIICSQVDVDGEDDNDETSSLSSSSKEDSSDEESEMRTLYAMLMVNETRAPRFIKWPRREEATRVIKEFQRAKGFPGVIGAANGSFIQIRAHKKDAASYICRKKYPAIHLQAVCDARSLFTYCYAGHVGFVHDARVFRNSPLAEFIQRPDEYFLSNSYLLGDAAYTVHPHVMIPFRDNGLTVRQKNFNYCLSSTRMAIERALGLLKVRFRILLDCLPLTDITKITQFIVACCVMHNICILSNDNVDVAVCSSNENVAPGDIAAGADLGN